MFIKASISVPRSLFYGPADIVGDTIVVKGTTVEAFSSLIRFIQYDDPDYIPPTDNRQKLVEIHQLAEKYQVTRLIEEVKKMLIELPIKVENILEFENTFKVDLMPKDVVDYEINIKVENLSNDIPSYDEPMKVESSDGNIKLEKNLDDPLKIENKIMAISAKESYICDTINIESQFLIPTNTTKNKPCTKENPHQCLDCPKEFSYAYDLDSHKMVHTGEKTFP